MEGGGGAMSELNHFCSLIKNKEQNKMIHVIHCPLQVYPKDVLIALKKKQKKKHYRKQK